MKFLLDESADFPLAAFLRTLSLDVTVIAYDYPQAFRDREVLAIAYREGRILLTSDRDFGELIFRYHLSHSGVILFRLGADDISVKVAWLVYVLTHYAQQLGEFIVITDRGVRVRHTK